MAKLDIKTQKVLNFEGEEDSSLFFRPLIQGMNLKILVEMQTKLGDLFKRYNDTSDGRALAIIGALSVENELDSFLSSWIIKYRSKKMNKKTFNSKIELAISLNLIPTKILESIRPIQNIRNIFAHNLDIDSFEKAKDFNRKPFPQLHDKLKEFKIEDIQDDKEAFKKLIFMIIVALNIYTGHMIKIQKYVWNPENLKVIMETDL